MNIKVILVKVVLLVSILVASGSYSVNIVTEALVVHKASGVCIGKLIAQGIERSDIITKGRDCHIKGE